MSVIWSRFCFLCLLPSFCVIQPVGHFKHCFRTCRTAPPSCLPTKLSVLSCVWTTIRPHTRLPLNVSHANIVTALNHLQTPHSSGTWNSLNLLLVCSNDPSMSQKLKNNCWMDRVAILCFKCRSLYIVCPFFFLLVIVLVSMKAHLHTSLWLASVQDFFYVHNLFQHLPFVNIYSLGIVMNIESITI